MPRSPAASFAALIRLPNLLIAAAGVAIGAALVLGRFAFHGTVLVAMAAAIGLGAAGNTANDLYDLDADLVNRPARPLPSGGLSTSTAIMAGGLLGGLGLLAAWLAGREAFIIAAASMIVMLVYSPLLKRHGLLGNLAVAVVGSVPLVFGAAAAGYWRVGLVPWGLAALLHFAREVVKDLEDVPGDKVAGRRTVPIVWGEPAAFIAAAVALIVFISAALLPWFAGWYGMRYGALAALAALGAAGLIVRLLHHQVEGVSLALKGLMVLGLAALVWDRL